jgi:hypothetical protein
MTPQEKAIELVDKMMNADVVWEFTYNCAKQCALIAVDEILEQIGILGCYENFGRLAQRAAYWLEVKKEIEKL